MKPLAFNLRNAKKVDSDKTTSTFELDSGHRIQILHSAVSNLQRKQMEKMPLCSGGKVEKMAEGGDVLPKYMKPPKNPKMEAVGTGGVAMKEGGVVDKPSQLDLSEPNTSMTVPKAARDDTQTKMKEDQTWQKPADDSGTIKTGEYKMYAEGTVDQPVSDQDMAPQAPTQDVQPPAVAPPSAQEAQVPVQTQPNPVNQMSGAQINPQVAPTSPDKPLYNQNGTANVPAAVALQIEAEKQKRDAAIAEGAQTANIQHGMNAATIVQAQNDQNRYNELKGHADDLSRDMQFINPNHYMESKGTLGRVATAMGLFLGGLGGGIAQTGGNAALDYLNRQIDRDIDSQKANNEKRKTIYGAYEHLYGEGNIASNMTKVSMNNLYDGQMKELAAKMATPRAMANYNAFHADILLKNHELLRTSTADSAIPRAGGTNLNIQPTPLDRGPVGQQSGRQALPQKQSHPGSVKSDGQEDHLLTPGARKAFELAQVGKDPRFQGPEGEQVRHELEGAALADQAIDAIHEHFPGMHKAITNGEYEPTSTNPLRAAAAGVANTIRQVPGYIRHKADSFEGIPIAGPVASGMGRVISDTEDNRDYETHRASVMSAITSALVHAGVAPNEAAHSAAAFAPIEGDSKAMVDEKARRAIEKLKSVIPKDAIRVKGFLRQQKKK